MGFAIMANAQIAKWLIEPEYDAIYMAPGTDAVITESAQTKTLWDFNGKKLAVTENELREFREGRAIVAIPREPLIDCILKEDGQSIPISNCSYAAKFPYYSCGKLLVYDSEIHCYKFLNLNGEGGRGQYLEDSYPFFNGYARCQILGEKDKRNVVLIDENEEVVPFYKEKGNKEVKREDILFVSSVNDDDVAIVVIKENVYTFDGKTKELAPFYAPGMEATPKNHAKIDKANLVDGKVMVTFSDKGVWAFSAMCGDKKEKLGIVFEFDVLLRPISYSVDGVKTYYNSKTETAKEYSTSLRVGNELGLVGLCWENGEELLPPQFDEVLQCFGNKAFVKLTGKYGMLEIDNNSHFGLTLNEGKDVVFIHKDLKTTVRVECPPFVPAEMVSLEFDPYSKISLDKYSCDRKNTTEGNKVEYSCTLSIPESLTDVVEIVNYPARITYDRFKSSWIDISIGEYFYKKFDIRINDKSINNGTLTLDFEITDNKPDEQAINLDVNVSAYTLVKDSVNADTLNLVTDRIQKISETHYRYEVYGLHEGLNTVVVDVAEPDCPISSFSYDMEYHKPVAKTPTTEETQEKVEQKGSTKVVVKSRYPIVKPSPTPKPTPKPTPVNPTPIKV